MAQIRQKITSTLSNELMPYYLTISSIASRISQHKSTMKLGGGCKVQVRDHFTKVRKKATKKNTENMSVMPIKLLPDNATLKELENIEGSCMLQ